MIPFVEFDALTVTLDAADDSLMHRYGTEGKPGLPLAIAIELLLSAASRQRSMHGRAITIDTIRQHHRLSPNSPDAFAVELRPTEKVSIPTDEAGRTGHQTVEPPWGLYCDRRDRDGQILEHSCLHYSCGIRDVAIPDDAVQNSMSGGNVPQANAPHDHDTGNASTHPWLPEAIDIQLDQELMRVIERSKIDTALRQTQPSSLIKRGDGYGHLETIGFGRCDGLEGILIATGTLSAPVHAPLDQHPRLPGGTLTHPGVIDTGFDVVTRLANRVTRSNCESVGLQQLILGRRVDAGEPLNVVAKWLTTSPDVIEKEKDGGVCTATILSTDGDLIAQLLGVEIRQLH